MKVIFLAAIAVIAIGCGSDQTVTVGDSNQPGAYKSSIDRSRQVANTASDRIKQGDAATSGL